MKITTDRLPSQGKMGQAEMELKLITNSEMTKLSLSLGKHKNDLEKYYRNIKLLLTGIVGWERAPLYDLFPILFFSKAMNFTTDDSIELNITCPHCGKQFPFMLDLNNDLEYPEVSEELLKIKGIKLGGEELPMIQPTIADFVSTIETLLPFSDSYEIEDLAFLTYFDFKSRPNIIIEKMNKAVKEEILLIHSIKEMLICVPRVKKSIPCSHCNKEVVIGDVTNVLITNPFRDLRKYCKLPKDLLIYK